MAARLSDPPASVAFADKITLQPSGCWQWIGAKQQQQVGKGQPVYGSFRSELAHRWAYRVAHGKIPRGLVVDHLCKNSLCVNPYHLEAVTQKANNTRRINAQTKQTHCIRGHAFTLENTGVDHRGHRFCRQCKRRYAADRRQHGKE
jgi:hypothetical protein